MDISFSRFGEFSFTPSLWYYFPSSVDARNLKVSSFHGVPKCTHALFLFFFLKFLIDLCWGVRLSSLSPGLIYQSFRWGAAWLTQCFISCTTSVWFSLAILALYVIPFSYLWLTFIFPPGLCFCFLGVYSDPLSCFSTVIIFFCLYDLGRSHWYLLLWN